MATGQIGLSFSLNQVPIKNKFDIRINVREDFNFLRYGPEFGDQNVGISFLDSPEMNVEENILIKDLSFLNESNSSDILTEESFFSQNFSLINSSFLLTDIFKTQTDGTTIPFYYGHSLSNFSNISDVTILDGDFNPVNLDLFAYFDETVALGAQTKTVYTNLASSYDITLKTYIVYYVRFKDIDANEIRIELLNAKELYSPSSFAVTTKERRYTLSPQGGNTDIFVSFDSRSYSPTAIVGTHRFSVKITGSNRIQLIRPIDLPATEKWYPRFYPGEFFQNTGSGDARYYIPEFETQFFTPVSPYKLLVEKRARVLEKRLLFVEPSSIANLGIKGFFIYIILKDRFGKTLRALTNDPSSSVYMTPGGKVTDIFYEKEMIQSVSESNGMIRLNTDIEVDAFAYVTFRYAEKFYSYRGISLNSTTTSKVLNRKVLFYLKPAFSGSEAKTIFHLLIDENGLILESNESNAFTTTSGISESGTINTITDSSLSGIDIYTGYELEMLSGLNAGRKLQVLSYSAGTKTLTLSEDFASIISTGDRYRINKKEMDDSYFDEISATTFSYPGWRTLVSGAPFHYLLLAETHSVQTISADDIKEVDIRIRGGGVKENKVQEALKLQDQVQWYWDVGYWDGQPYPGMGAMLVELPRKILKEVGGSFSRGQVEEIVHKHLASGVYPVIKYYDRSTEILGLEPVDQKILASWADVKGDSYNVYVGQNPDQLSLYKTVAGIILELDITGLENNKVYYIMIESVFNGVAQLPSRTAFAIPFNPRTIKVPAVYGVSKYQGGTYSNG